MAGRYLMPHQNHLVFYFWCVLWRRQQWEQERERWKRNDGGTNLRTTAIGGRESATTEMLGWRTTAPSKGSGGGEDGSGGRYPSLLFFSNHCGQSFCLAYVELYSRNSTKGNIAIFPLSLGIYPAGGGIYPKRRETPIELETVVVESLRPFLMVEVSRGSGTAALPLLLQFLPSLGWSLQPTKTFFVFFRVCRM